MGVVRDVTIDQLTQAVQGISSTGISDSTGQAINNTLGTLSKDITLQATNTELGNIDSTGQSIASAISGLGQTLGANKADIDGSNIANPSAFRQNIGISIGSLTSANTKVSVISGYYLQIANVIFIDAIFTANQAIGTNEYLLSGQPTIGNNNYPLVCALAEGGANSNNLARLYASYIVANGSLTVGKSYHCFGSYTI